MAKLVQGSCNRCGHCGCYAFPDSSNDHWCPGIPSTILDWYLMYPDPTVQKFAAYMINRAGYMKGYVGGGHFSIPGVGRIVYWINAGGIQKSETDKSCPFFLLGSPNKCVIFGEEWLHASCANNPQSFTDEYMMIAWMANHPLCGYSWIDIE